MYLQAIKLLLMDTLLKCQLFLDQSTLKRFRMHTQQCSLLLSTTTLYNVCLVPWGVLSTAGYHEYRGGISWVPWGWSVPWVDILSAMGDTLMHVGRYNEYRGGVQYRGGIQSLVIWVPPTVLHDVPSHLSYPPRYSTYKRWYAPTDYKGNHKTDVLCKLEVLKQFDDVRYHLSSQHHERKKLRNKRMGLSWDCWQRQYRFSMFSNNFAFYKKRGITIIVPRYSPALNIFLAV